jgi:hypothetical protein
MSTQCGAIYYRPRSGPDCIEDVRGLDQLENSAGAAGTETRMKSCGKFKKADGGRQYLLAGTLIAKD